jgi:molybdopterin molybdotransferase
MISVAEALARITSALAPVSSEQVPLSDGLGRVLAEDVRARVTHPPAAVSAMDGYAVRAEDVARAPATLRLVGESQAGGRFAGAVGPGEAVRIFTGAPLPPGADAIVIQENAERAGDRVTVREPAAAGRFVRPAGLDFRAGDALLKAGTVLTARDLGLAAAMNVPWLAVRRRPRVAFIATGDEIVMPGEPLGADQIVSSNSVALAAYVRAWGGEPLSLGIARDDAGSLNRLFAGARGADLLVTMGGASVGDHDLVREALGGEGFALEFFRVAMRPGKPLVFGRLGEVPVLGLPGNPVSVGVTAVVFLKPAVDTLLGVKPGGGPPATAALGCDVGANDQRQDYLRATLARAADGTPVATPFPRQDSSMLARFAAAHCLVVRPPNAPPAKAGERVEIIPLAGGVVSF